MEDNEKEVEATSSRGADWEVVSLKASSYVAAPCPKEFDQANENTGKEKDNERQSPDALFMSQHFVFPPNEHENLPIEPELTEIHNVIEGHRVSSYLDDGNDGFDEADKENLLTEFDNHSHEVEFFDEGNSPKLNKEDKFDGSSLPCEAWWKRHSASLYRQVREANTFWSVVVAAAVMGLVIMGQQWQKDKWQLHQLKLRFSISEEKLIRMLRPIGRFKGILFGSNQHPPLIQDHGVGATTNL